MRMEQESNAIRARMEEMKAEVWMALERQRMRMWERGMRLAAMDEAETRGEPEVALAIALGMD